MKEVPYDMDELIGKVLAGEASEAEIASLTEWIHQKKENARYFEQLKAIFAAASSNVVSLQFDTDAAWQKVKNKLPKESKQIPFRSFRNWTSLKIAAGVLIALAVGYSSFNNLRQANQIREVASGSSTKADTLPDGSTAFLNRKSKLKFRYAPSENVRKLSLTGEAFFEVRHEESKPFIIETDEVFIRDIGTSFNVQAWPESNTVEVTVEDGEVQIYTLRNSGMSLHAGEKGVYDKTLRAFSKIEKIDTNVLAYKTKVFTFNNTDLHSVIALISSVYNVDIHLSNEALNDCRLTVNFNNDPLDTVIEILSETMGLTVSKKGAEIILSGTGCQK